MKTKYTLFALCLPIAFTACQNEEFVKDYSQELKNRGEIDVILSANYPTVGNSVDTRMDVKEEGKNLNFLWEQGTDKLGAAMMDGATPGQVADQALVLVNSPFIAQDNGATSEFASPAPLTKGIYLFYNSYKDVLDREALSLSLQPQEFDPASQKTSVQQMVKYMNMVAPMVNLNKGIKLEDAPAFNLPLEFVNLYTPVKVPVVFEGAKQGTKLTKISIDDKNPIALGGELNTGVLAGASSLYDKVLVLKKDESGKMTILPEDLAAAKEDVDAIVQNGAGATGIYKDASKVTGAAELTIKDGMDLSNGEQKEFWILIPRGTYTDLRITVETTNGTATIEKSISSELVGGVNPQIFNSQHRALQPVVLNFSDGGNVTVPKAFTINNTTDWDNAIQYIQSNASAYMGDAATLTIGREPVYITSIPTDIAFTLAGTNNPDSKLIFGDKDGKPVDIALNLKRITMDTYTHLEVGEGANVTINNAHAGTLASLTNNGTLTMKAIGTITTFTNNDELNFDAAMTVGNVANKAGATINVKAATTFTQFTNEAKAGEKVAAKIVVAEGASLELSNGNTNKGVIENKGTLTNGSTFTNDGTVDNHGTLTVSNTWTNNGTIIAQDGGVSNNAAIAGTGTIEVMNVSTYPGAGQAYNFSGGTINAIVTNHADYITAKTATMKVTLDGGDWTIKDGTPAEESRDLTASEADYALNLKGNLNVKVDADLNSAGDLTVSGDKSTITVDKGVNLTVKSLTVNEGATATIAGEGKVILPNDANVNVNGTLTNNGTIVTPEVGTEITALSGIKKFNIVVAAGATLNNNGTIGGEQNTQANITSTNGDLDNAKGVIYGAVETAGFNSFNRGTVHVFPKIKANKADLSDFAGATEIEAVTTAVTKLPANTNVNITVASGSLELVASTHYGELTISAATTMTAAGAGAVIEKITIAQSITLTSNGGSYDITCWVMAGEGDLTNTDSHLVKPNGGGAWAWPAD